MKFSDKDIALVSIGNPSFLKNISISHTNEYFSCIGRRVCEFRLVQNVKLEIESTIRSLQSFNIILIAGSFGFQPRHYVVQIIADIFKTDLEINDGARAIYMKRLALNNIIYDERYQKAFMLPPNALVMKLSETNFAFRYANIVCFDDTYSTLTDVVNILQNTLQSPYVNSTRHIFTQIPEELFYFPVRDLANEMGVKWDINSKRNGGVRISAWHTDLLLLKKFMSALEQILIKLSKNETPSVKIFT